LKKPGGSAFSSFDQDRGRRARPPTIEQVSAIVHGGVGREFDRSHFRIDSDLAMWQLLGNVCVTPGKATAVRTSIARMSTNAAAIAATMLPPDPTPCRRR